MLGSSHRVTIKDVAARSGVSTQTVSRVINNRPDVAADTRERVEEVIASLGYTPSAVARTLVARRSNSIGVLLAGMAYTGTALTLRGIVDEAASLGLTVLIAELPEGDSLDDPRPAISALVEHHVDGIIMSVPAIGQAVDRIKAVLTDKAVVEKLQATGQDVIPGSAAEFAASIEAQSKAVSAIAKTLGIKEAAQ